MNVTICGASGFIGTALLKRFRGFGWDVRIIDRLSLALPLAELIETKLSGADVVINLAGTPVAGKWTPERKKSIYDSRILTTRHIVAAINQAPSPPPALFISASAVGIYSSEGTHDEQSTGYASTFLADVCKDWEKEASAIQSATRLVILRLGVVLGRNGGALVKMEKPFRLGTGGKLGNGEQAVSFIHINDLVDAVIFLIENTAIHGIVNAVSPYPSTNYEFTDKLGKVLQQPTWFTVPAFALKMIYGEGAQVLLEGQRVIPGALQHAGFRFQFPTIQNTLVDLYR
jgi:uncharacterized protein (TIGR01777 family)